MKPTIKAIFFLAFIQVVVSNDSCDPWPVSLKTIEECCELPYLFESDTEMFCTEKCAPLINDLKQLTACMDECFLANSSVVTENRKLNEDGVKNISFIFGNIEYISPAWQPVTLEALRICELNEAGDVNRDLANFKGCVRDYLKQHCASFMTSPECELVEVHAWKCRRIEVNCSIWPYGYEMCCDAPEMFKFKKDIIESCEKGCREKEFFQILLRKCFFDCIATETKMVVGDEFDFEVVKELLMFNNSLEWEKPVTNTLEKCQLEFKGWLSYF